MMKTLFRLLLFIVLLVTPIAGQWFWYHPGPAYSAPELVSVEETELTPLETSFDPFIDEPIAGTGRVIVDLSHSNNLAIDDLSPLRDRLVARGVEVETYDGFSDSLEQVLRGATALLVLAPANAYDEYEQKLVHDFVADGGRLLLAADPTRPAFPQNPNEAFELADFFFPVSAVPAINSLANQFGLIYYDDYLYNMENNAGNYRNVRLNGGPEPHQLVEPLTEVVFFASHSIETRDQVLLTGDTNTRSPLRRGDETLAAAALAADEQVLALGDITFLTPAYQNMADNARFVSRIADWLAVDQRERTLEDVPYLFGPSVDLVQAAEGYLDTRLIARSGDLQQRFAAADRTLNLRAEAQPGNDIIFVSTFDSLERVEPFLATAGVTITLVSDDEVDEAGELESVDDAASEDEDDTPEAEAGEDDADVEATDDEDQEQVLEVSGLGTIGTAGTTLFVVDRQDDVVTLVTLADDGEMALAALERLTAGDFFGCIVDEPITICSTGETQAGSGLVDEEEVTDDSAGFDDDFDADSDFDDESFFDDDSLLGSILIIAADVGLEGTRTSEADIADLLTGIYDITTWSLALDGFPDADELAAYDALIVDFGDYRFDTGNDDLLTLFERITTQEMVNVMFIGSQPLPVFDEASETAPIEDLSLEDPNHPMAFGFFVDETVTLSPSESGVPAILLPLDLIGESDTSVVFNRGPESVEAGSPALVASIDDSGSRAILATFAFYRLPEIAQIDLAFNAADWLLGAE